MPNLKYKRDIAQEYGFCPKTLQRKLASRKINLPRGYLDPLHQREIYEALGYPPGVCKQDYLDLDQGESVPELPEKEE
jgi:hypothetical protein